MPSYQSSTPHFSGQKLWTLNCTSEAGNVSVTPSVDARKNERLNVGERMEMSTTTNITLFHIIINSFVNFGELSLSARWNATQITNVTDVESTLKITINNIKIIIFVVWVQYIPIPNFCHLTHGKTYEIHNKHSY